MEKKDSVTTARKRGTAVPEELPESRDKRSEIIKAAQECFFEKGYEATSVRMIMKKVEAEVGLFYYYFENKSLRRFINKLLPFFSKYNSLLLVLALVSSILHILGIFINTPILNTGYAVFFILLLVTKFTFFGSKNSNNSYILNVLSYLLLFALVIHYFI